MEADGRPDERQEALITTDTIFALSSGPLPAAIAVVRVSGPRAFAVLDRLAGRRPEVRRASVVELRADGVLLDRALVLRFGAPDTVTGEDLVELHLHGGRAVVGAVQTTLQSMEGVRQAEAGEFTRRAFHNGRLDLTEVEGLSDLLAAETEAQRRAAIRAAEGGLSRTVNGWSQRLLGLAAGVEAQLDFSDEGDVDVGLPASWEEERRHLEDEIATLLERPPAERLRDGVRVVIAGPPNSGKSTLLNALVGREAAITSHVAGTTRDLIEVPVALAGMPFLLIDSAGLRESEDHVETIGIERAHDAIGSADILLWLGALDAAPHAARCVTIKAKSDLGGDALGADLAVSARTGAGMDVLIDRLISEARRLLPLADAVSVNARQRAELGQALAHISAADSEYDLLIAAEELRQARAAFDRVTGRAGVDDMLNALFGRFCIGK